VFWQDFKDGPDDIMVKRTLESIRRIVSHVAKVEEI